MRLFPALITFLTGVLCTSAGEVDRKEPIKSSKIVLTELLDKQFSNGGELKKALRKAQVINPAVAVAAIKQGRIYHVVVARRTNPRLKTSVKEHMLRRELTRSLFNLAATNSEKLVGALDAYKYKKVLVDYAHNRLYTKFHAQVSELGLHMKLHLDKAFSTGIIEIPVDKVAITGIDLISDEKTHIFYRNALNKSVKASIEKKEYAQAAAYLLEIKKYGAFTTGMMVDFYHCYTMGGNTTQARQAYGLLVQKVTHFSYDELVQLSVVASKSKLEKQEEFWNLQAESRIQNKLTLDMLLKN